MSSDKWYCVLRAPHDGDHVDGRDEHFATDPAQVCPDCGLIFAMLSTHRRFKHRVTVKDGPTK